MKRLPLLPLRNKATTVGALCLVAALGAGCKKKEEPAPTAPPHAPTSPAPSPKPAPVQKPVSSAGAPSTAATFDFKGRRDPFKPFVEPQTQQPKPAEQPLVAPKGEQLPIQSYEVTKFKVSGIIVGIRQNRALLVDPQGKPYVVQEGMAVGNHDGRIARITPTSVEVVERFRDEKGRARKRTIVLTLAKKR